jgi:hypothetical protein
MLSIDPGRADAIRHTIWVAWMIAPAEIAPPAGDCGLRERRPLDVVGAPVVRRWVELDRSTPAAPDLVEAASLEEGVVVTSARIGA